MERSGNRGKLEAGHEVCMGLILISYVLVGNAGVMASAAWRNNCSATRHGDSHNVCTHYIMIYNDSLEGGLATVRNTQARFAIQPPPILANQAARTQLTIQAPPTDAA